MNEKDEQSHPSILHWIVRVTRYGNYAKRMYTDFDRYGYWEGKQIVD
ncbi:MAG: hypothetical protein ACRD8Z_20720 [Nitrososphaeraceae archaeon]